MKKIELRGKNALGKFVVVDDEDYEYLSKWAWALTQDSYAFRITQTSDGVRHSTYMHQQIMRRSYIDHINGNRLDNRRSNLRHATRQQNMWNRAKQNRPTASIYKGVAWDNERKMWMTRITCKGRSTTIGRFKNERHAGMAYDIWAKDLFGTFARTNF